jgi:NAD-dependent SIR2 family protein deacetylase
LGAGASKPEPSNIPTVKELLPELLERGRRLDRDDVTKLADFCERRKINNIEDLLTAAQVATFCSRNPSILQLVNYLLYGADSRPYEPEFVMGTTSLGEVVRRRPRELAADLSSVAFLQDTLQVLFGLLSSTMLPAKPNPAHEAIASYARDHGGSTIVTTNYDCCMDLALGEVIKDFDYRLEFANLRTENTGQNDTDELLPIPILTELIKLHGSLNWFYCETCQKVQLFDIRHMVDNFLQDIAPYPVIGICRSCGGQSRGLLVPPLAMKFDLAPPLTPLSAKADEAFGAADAIIVVGFSFADADLYISRMLSKSMQTKSDQKLFIVDPEEQVVSRVRRKFKASIPNFDVSRIIRMTGDCADILPKFLGGQLLTAKPEDIKQGAGVQTPATREPPVSTT